VVHPRGGPIQAPCLLERAWLVGLFLGRLLVLGRDFKEMVQFFELLS
jgi:hypothetical protein